jgi:hypothetical protein
VNGNGRMSHEPAYVDLAPRVRPVVAKAARDEADVDAAVETFRRRKWARFILTELLAIAVLVPSAELALAHHFSNPTLILAMNLLTIISAVVAALIPVMFFAIPPRLPR